MPVVKRPRTPVACQRCKSRKQRCDGEIPKCANCEKANADCVYSRAFYRGGQTADTTKYIAKLESQIATLSAQLQTNDLNKAPQVPPSEAPYVGATAGMDVVRTINHHLSGTIPDYGALNPSYPCVPGQGISTPEVEISAEEAKQFANVYVNRSHWRHPVVDRRELDAIMMKRENRVLTNWEKCLFHMVMAIGSRLEALLGSKKQQRSEQLYNTALYYLNNTTMSHFQYCQACILGALFASKSDVQNGPSAWMLVGMAVRCATELGLHRRQEVLHNEDSQLMEHRKRVFWTAYLLDRLYAIHSGRPNCIPEHEIDVQLPVEENDNVDAKKLHEARIIQARNHHIHMPQYQKPIQLTNMTPMVYMCRLRRIESRIQRDVYAPQVSMMPPGDVSQFIMLYDNELNQWVDSLPTREMLDAAPYETGEYFFLNYFRVKKLLLKPQFDTLDPSTASQSKVFHDYVYANGAICQSFRAMHQRYCFTFTPVALQTIYVAGLNLLYCYWLDRTSTGLQASEDIKTCSRLLHAFVERWPNVAQVRDNFDELMDKVFNEPDNASAAAANNPRMLSMLPDDWNVTPWT